MAHTPVTVAPGATAYALLIVGNPDVYNCPVGMPTQVRVFPPNERADARVDVNGLRVCSNQVTGSHINPVVAQPNF
jgi:hypothetical protein